MAVRFSAASKLDVVRGIVPESDIKKVLAWALASVVDTCVDGCAGTDQLRDTLVAFSKLKVVHGLYEDTSSFVETYSQANAFLEANIAFVKLDGQSEIAVPVANQMMSFLDTATPLAKTVQQVLGKPSLSEHIEGLQKSDLGTKCFNVAVAAAKPAVKQLTEVCVTLLKGKVEINLDDTELLEKIVAYKCDKKGFRVSG